MEISYDLAKKILGDDFISPEEIMKFRKGITYTDEQLAYFKKTIPSQEILEWCRDNDCVIIAGSNSHISFLDIRNLNRDYLYIKEDGYYNSKKIVSNNDKIETKWYLFYKKLFPETANKNWDYQKQISECQIIPNLAEFTWFITTYKAVRDVYLFDSTLCRVSNFDSNNIDYHFCVGLFDKYGFSLKEIYDDDTHPNLGVTVIYKELVLFEFLKEFKDILNNN